MNLTQDNTLGIWPKNIVFSRMPAWAHSSSGIARPWHGRGEGFESPWVHILIMRNAWLKCEPKANKVCVGT